MSSHEHRESRFDEPPESDRPIPGSGAAGGFAPRKNAPDYNPFADTDDTAPPADTSPSRGDTRGIVQSLSEALQDLSETSAGQPSKPTAARTDARWDADDPRRRDDPFAPPTQVCECHCLHCGRTFSSEDIWLQRVINDPRGRTGFWMCPTPNCSGAGFTFDIFPTDPDHPANEGWLFDDEDEDELSEAAGLIEDEDDDDSDDDDVDWSESAFDADGDTFEYDPAEPHYQDMDDLFGDDLDDMEGEEWKYGLQPGERPPEPAWREEARREWENDQTQYDEPDRRPRVLDWSEREDSADPPYHYRTDDSFSDDDIPF